MNTQIRSLLLAAAMLVPMGVNAVHAADVDDSRSHAARADKDAKADKKCDKAEHRVARADKRADRRDHRAQRPSVK